MGQNIPLAHVQTACLGMLILTYLKFPILLYNVDRHALGEQRAPLRKEKKNIDLII